VFDRNHCSFSRFIGEFSLFIGKIGRYSPVGDFTVHIFNQINFSQFLPNFTEFDPFFKKLAESDEANFFSVRQFFKQWRGGWWRARPIEADGRHTIYCNSVDVQM
jgi:hypothetical protein